VAGLDDRRRSRTWPGRTRYCTSTPNTPSVGSGAREVVHRTSSPSGRRSGPHYLDGLGQRVSVDDEELSRPPEPPERRGARCAIASAAAVASSSIDAFATARP
jgi:hypothetical protein